MRTQVQYINALRETKQQLPSDFPHPKYRPANFLPYKLNKETTLALTCKIILDIQQGTYRPPAARCYKWATRAQSRFTGSQLLQRQQAIKVSVSHPPAVRSFSFKRHEEYHNKNIADAIGFRFHCYSNPAAPLACMLQKYICKRPLEDSWRETEGTKEWQLH